MAIGGLIQDPNSLGYEIAYATSVTSKELVIDTANLVIKLTRVGNLTADGVTLNCLYTKLTQIWATNANANVKAFPLNSITTEQFELINGWNFDKTPNPTTKITVLNCFGANTSTTLTCTTAIGFIQSNVFPRAYVIGSNGLAANVRVTSVDSNLSLTLSSPNQGTISATNLTFYGDVDYTYNLIRTGGWAVKANVGNVTTSEEWMGVISLGSLGSEGLTTTTTLTGNVIGSNTITVSDSTTSVVGSFVFGANIPYGATITNIISNTQFTISKTIGNAYVGSIVTIHPKDQPYYQLGANLYAIPTTTIIPGQVNQPVQIYGNTARGNFDYRTNTNVFNIYTREQAYTYYQASKTDIGFANLTYQVYRFPLVSTVDTNIIDSDSTISSNGLYPTASPWNAMSITWYATPQARIINGVTYYFSVIIDAQTTASTYGTATAQQVYEYVQWALRRPYAVDIDSGPLGRNGGVTRQLLQYTGTTLQTIYDSSDGGVYIDHFRVADINTFSFEDNNRLYRNFNYVSQGTLSFNSYLATDGANTTFSMFFKQINQGNVISAGYTVRGSLTYGTRNAQIVKGFSTDPSGDGSYEIRGNLLGANPSGTTVNFDMLWENNPQAIWLPNNYYYVNDEYVALTSSGWQWYRVTGNYVSGATWGANNDSSYGFVIPGPTVYLVAQGRATAQYTITSPAVTILKSITNSIMSAATQEKNYGT
jgi:hypothetical protein